MITIRTVLLVGTALLLINQSALSEPVCTFKIHDINRGEQIVFTRVHPQKQIDLDTLQVVCERYRDSVLSRFTTFKFLELTVKL